MFINVHLKTICSWCTWHHNVASPEPAPCPMMHTEVFKIVRVCVLPFQLKPTGTRLCRPASWCLPTKPDTQAGRQTTDGGKKTATLTSHLLLLVASADRYLLYKSSAFIRYCAVFRRTASRRALLSSAADNKQSGAQTSGKLLNKMHLQNTRQEHYDYRLIGKTNQT